MRSLTLLLLLFYTFAVRADTGNLVSIACGDYNIVVKFWDNGEVQDGDRVTVRVDDQILVSDFNLNQCGGREPSSGPCFFNLVLPANSAIPVEVYVHNVGTASPNTAALKIIGSCTSELQEWKLNTGQTGTMTIQTGSGVSPISGSCGSASGGSYASQPTSGLCSAGTASGTNALNDGSGWYWYCDGSNGGSYSYCTANKLTVTNGNGTSVTVKPTSNLCAAGTAGSVTGSGPWYWNCSAPLSEAIAEIAKKYHATESGFLNFLFADTYRPQKVIDLIDLNRAYVNKAYSDGW